MGDDGAESLAEIIERLDEATAKMLLERASAESSAVAATVRLAVAVPADRVAILRAEADAVLRTRRHLDYREANEMHASNRSPAPAQTWAAPDAQLAAARHSPSS